MSVTGPTVWPVRFLRRQRRHPETVAPAETTDSAKAVEFAWRVHEGIGSWTSRVDTKASIALAIEAVILGFAVNLATGTGELATASGVRLYLLGLGVLLLVASIVLSVAVIFPQLRRSKVRAEYRENFIYFGHLQHWHPEDLSVRLAGEPIPLEQISRQLVNMSTIAWRKHAWLQWSLGLLLTGILIIGSAVVANRIHGDAASPSPSTSVSTTQTPAVN